MNHSLAARIHCSARIRERLNRPAFKKDIDKMRLALSTGNSDCFMRREYPGSIKGIVRYQNIWTVAVLDKGLGIVKTVGVSL